MLGGCGLLRSGSFASPSPHTQGAWVRAKAMVSTRASAGRQATEAEAIHAGYRLQKVLNFRDLSESFPAITPGSLYRCAAPVKATSADIHTLLDTMGVKKFIDLRSSEELEMDKVVPPVFADVSFCKWRVDSATKRCVPDAANTVMRNSNVMRYQMPLLERNSYYMAMLGRVPLRDAAYIVATRVLAPRASKQHAITKVNEGGLELLYKIILDISRPYLAGALRVISDAAEAEEPLLFFCRVGKDRTGLVSMLLLGALGASDDVIIADYHKSDAIHMVALAGIDENDEVASLDKAKFERAPAEVMASTLAHIRTTFGGIPRYLDNQCGFTIAEQARLRELLLRPRTRALKGSRL